MRIQLYLFLVLMSGSSVAQLSVDATESTFYTISDIKIPKDIVLEVGGMVFNDEEKLAVCTRRGEIWEIENPTSKNPSYTRFAHGLHEPLGLNYKDGSYYVAQRGELTKLSDLDGDGIADDYRNIYSWPLEGNYHEYSYGPKFLPNGDMIVSLNLGWIGKGASLSKWRGWVVQISPEGELTPISTGMRSPAGIGFNANGDLFYTENQGDWVGSGRMTHVEKGDFVGNPEGLKWSGEEGSPVTLKVEDIAIQEETTLYEFSKKVKGVKPPSVWFPHTLMGISTSDLVVIPEGFGPFEGQLLVGDQGHSKIMRVFQEKVNGVYQGICFPFREGFESGILRMVFGADRQLYVGMTSRGWASTGKEPYGLQRLSYNGLLPFEMEKVEITAEGFRITFTEAIDEQTAKDLNSYKLTEFNYKYHEVYGSPAILQEQRGIRAIDLSEDLKSIELKVDGLRPGFITEINLEGIRNANGQPLLHSKGYYTANEIPGGGDSPTTNHEHANSSETIELISPKRPTKMPDSWVNGPDQEVVIGTKPGLKYDVETIRVQAGSKLKLTFNNNDDMLHNLLIVKPETADAVGQKAVDLGLDGLKLGFVPDSEDVLYHTNLMQPESSDVIFIDVPSKKGSYQFVCTFPGHAAIMRGILIVE